MFTDMKDRQMRVPIVVLVLVLVAMITLLVFALVRPELPGARNTGPILYVQPAATGAGDGSSWSNATTLQDALRNRAVAGDEIWVAAGTHYPDQGAFQIGSGVAVYGGFVGTETSWDVRNPAVNITITKAAPLS